MAYLTPIDERRPLIGVSPDGVMVRVGAADAARAKP
jgi:hypothetical protein